MAKVTVVGNAAVVVSSLKLEDIKLLEKYQPDALVLKGGEDGKEEIFRVGSCEGPGNIGKYGAEFGGKNAEGFATLTFVHTYTEGDVREQIADAIGADIVNLSKVEVKATENIPEVVHNIEAMKEFITVVQ